METRRYKLLKDSWRGKHRFKSLRTKKDSPPSREKTVADPLTTFANKVRSDGTKQSAKELLMSQLSPPRCQIDFLPATVNLGKCNALDYESMKEFQDSRDTDKGNGALRSSLADPGQKGEKATVTGEEKETRCIECLMNDLSCDGEWLRNHLKSPLKMAIKEIVTKKPGDPVNYLGFWLLNYRKCIEKNLWQLEANRELEHYRSMVKPESVLEEEPVSEKGEEEEVARDWDFKYYESTEKPT